MTSEELLAEAKDTDLLHAKANGEGRSFDTYFPTAVYFRDRGMSFTWIFEWIKERHSELTEDRRESFVASMSARYRRQQKKLISSAK